MISAPARSKPNRTRRSETEGASTRPASLSGPPPGGNFLTDDRLTFGASMLGIVAICALASTIGADARWLAALGRLIATRGHIPAGVPFASASSAHWPNAIALGELIFHWLETALGGRGLMLAQ